MARRALSWILAAAGLMLVVAIMLVAKVYLEGRRDLALGHEALARGELTDAIVYLDRALHWYLPGASFVEDAASTLWRIGQDAETKEDFETALLAYRTLRSVFYAARSTYTPGKDWIARCDERIAELVADKPDFAARRPEMTREERRKEVLDDLKRDNAPDVFWSIMVEIGFFGWVGCTIAFIMLVFRGERGFSGRYALVFGFLVILFYGLWIVGMAKA